MGKILLRLLQGFAAAALMIGVAPGVSLAQAQSDPAPEKSSSGPTSDAPKTEYWAIHGQLTNIWQYHPSIRSPYQGAQSFLPHEGVNETTDATLFLGFRPWAGAEFWVNPEINQGIAPSDTLGAAGYVNGDGAKVGKRHPYFRVQRAFLRQTIDLGGDRKAVDPDLNQLGGAQSDNRLVLTIGKFNVTDIFDANQYAHNSKADFLNWSLIDTGSFDYAADAWGYSYGVAAEWYQGDWTLRGGVFALSVIPNGKDLSPGFRQFQPQAELERRYSVGGLAGKLVATVFVTRGHMGTFADALRLAEDTDTLPDTGAVRRYRSRPGVSFNLEQSLTKTLGLFARAGVDDGRYESYEYTDIDQSAALGLSMSGDRWGRQGDTVALAGVINQISKAHQDYLNAGGLGVLVGDGKLPHPGPEEILESYYSVGLNKDVHVSLDGQLIDNPAYNRDRGPVEVVSVRLHGQF